MNIVIHKTDGSIQQKKINTFEDMRKIVGGEVEILETDVSCLAFNEEGILKNLARNPAYPGVVGNVIVFDSIQDLDNLPYE